MRVLAAIVLLVLAQGSAGCDDGRSSTIPTGPLAPSAAPQPAPQPVPQPNSAQLNGSVFDSAYRPIAGARVEVLDGPQAGTFTTASATGAFSLTGTFDSATTFRATHEAHVGATRSWTQCAGCVRPWLGFRLAVIAPAVNVAGNYTLTFIADSVCADLPTEVRTRTYSATIAPDSSFPDVPANTAFTGTVSGAPLLEPYNSFSMSVAGDYVAFWIGDLHHGGPGVVERVELDTKPDNSAGHEYLAFTGEAAASSVETAVSAISAHFDGRIEYCSPTSEMGAIYDCDLDRAVTRARCESKNHQLILTRR